MTAWASRSTGPRAVRWSVLAVLGLVMIVSMSLVGTQTAGADDYVSVPDRYVYNPDANSQKTLHDYCTKSPDEFPAPGADNASFRGPCARHDLCYDAGKDKESCDDRLRENLKTNCDDEYGSWNPLRHGCRETADTYWEAIKLYTIFS